MSEVRLVIREEKQDWSLTIHGSDADRAIAALSADPTTLDELDAAMARFHKRDGDRKFFVMPSRYLNDQPHDAGLVVIDLAARLVVVDSTYSSPCKEGYIEYHNGQCCTETSLRYHLADDWKFWHDANTWQYIAEERRRERAAKPPLDARAIFYGKPMVEFIAREVFAAFGRREEIAAAARLEWVEDARKRLARTDDIAPEEVDAARLKEEEIVPKTWDGEVKHGIAFYDTLSQIHANWLLAPREDLGGLCPREISQQRRDHLTWDLQDRCEQWSQLKQCPPGLAESSHSFRFAGFGIHELVMYYDLVRALLWSSWDQLTAMADLPDAARKMAMMSVGDFLTTEVPRLEKIREEWLDGPNTESHGRTPRSIIARERARLPEVMTSQDAVHDPDCPCCQMLADLPGPMFWHYDGCNMDDEFAFDIYNRTLEDRDEEERRRQEFNLKFEAEQAECKILGVADRYTHDDGSNTEWSRKLSVDDVELPVGMRTFDIGCRLAELVVGLRAGAEREATPPEAQYHIDQLNRDFGNLRELLNGDDFSLAAALVDPVFDRFTENLNEISTARPELAEQCESLSGRLERLMDPPSSNSEWSFDDDDEIPF